jgi:hypothetical protein
MKYLLSTCFILLISLFLFIGHVFANEGNITMSGGSVSCEGMSVWKDSSYRILGRCNGLVYPYQERLDRYVLWVTPENETKPIRIDDIERGLFEGQTNKRFTSVFVTVEESSSPTVPGSIVIAQGIVTSFQNLQKGAPAAYAVPEQRLPQAPVITPTITPTKAPDTTLSPASLRTGGALPLILIGVLLIIVIGAVVYFRR